MRRTPLALSILLVIAPASSFAGVVVPGGSNPFLQNADTTNTPSLQARAGTPPPAAPVELPTATQRTPPPPMNPAAGMGATGYTSVPQGYAQNRKGALPPPRPGYPGGHPLPPPLPSNELARNKAISSGPAPAPAPVIVQSSGNMKDSYIRGPNVVNVLAQHIVVGTHSLSNVVVNLSGYAPNLFYTPFAHPNIIYTDAGALHWTPFGSKAMVAIDAKHPVGAILTGGQHGDPVINLTFVPKKIPGRNYIVSIEGWHPNPKSHSAPLPESARSKHFLAVMKAAALGQNPDSYARTSHLPGSQHSGVLTITPYARYLGSSHVLVEYHVMNASGTSVTLSESDFYRPGVVAVSFWPGGALSGHGQTRLFVLKRDARHHSGLIGFVGKE